MSFTTHKLGTLWYGGKEPQINMLQAARKEKHLAIIVRIDPLAGYRNYGSYSTWTKAIEHLDPLSSQVTHYFELMAEGIACKPYFDFDYKFPEDGSKSIDLSVFMEQVETVLTDIIQRLTQISDVEQIKQSFIWSDSSAKAKFSLHLVIHLQTNKNIWLAEDNIKSGYICELLISDERFPDVALCADRLVYTKNRVMRLAGSSKYLKTETLRLLKSDTLEQSIITCIPADKEIILLDIPKDYVVNKYRQVTSNQKSVWHGDTQQAESISIFNTPNLSTDCMSYCSLIYEKKAKLKDAAQRLSNRLEAMQLVRDNKQKGKKIDSSMQNPNEKK